MPRARTHRLILPLLLLLLTLVAQAAQAPAPLTITQLGVPLVELGGPWQFHLGDNPQWASPAYDASHWKTISTQKGWDLQGYPDTGNFGWYRRRVHFASPALARLPLAMPALPVFGAYEVFWNGRRVGGCGSFPPHFRIVTCWEPLLLPRGAGGPDAVIALRVRSVWTRSLARPNTQGLEGTPQLGTRDAAAANGEQLLYQEQRSGWVSAVTNLLYGVAGLLAGILWLLDRQERLYLWLSLFLAAKAFGAAVYMRFNLSGMSLQRSLAWQFNVGYGCLFLALCILLLRLFSLYQSSFWKRLTGSIVAAYLLASAGCGVLSLMMGSWNTASVRWYRILYALETALPVYLLVLVAAGLRRRAGAARWCVAVASTLRMLAACVSNGLDELQQWNRVPGRRSPHASLGRGRRYLPHQRFRAAPRALLCGRRHPE